VALRCFSAVALKCGAPDRGIGWTYRQQHARLSLLANDTRFCILDGWRRSNLASRVLARCELRIVQDWQQRLNHSVVLLETFMGSTATGTPSMRPPTEAT
jgi:hypothetical protein